MKTKKNRGSINSRKSNSKFNAYNKTNANKSVCSVYSIVNLGGNTHNTKRIRCRMHAIQQQKYIVLYVKPCTYIIYNSHCAHNHKNIIHLRHIDAQTYLYRLHKSVSSTISSCFCFYIHCAEFIFYGTSQS